MARIGGRNTPFAWVVGLVCAGVVGVLAVLALPAIPTAVTLVGDTLRSADAMPAFAQSATAPPPDSSTPACQVLYSEALWAELTQRAGGDPVQDASPPATAAASLVPALAPAVRATCVFTGVNTGRIVTTVADVGADAESVAEAAFEAGGFACDRESGGIRCTRTADGITEQDIVRGGVWVSTTFDGWQPDRYLDRMAPQLWPR